MGTVTAHTVTAHAVTVRTVTADAFALLNTFNAAIVEVTRGTTLDAFVLRIFATGAGRTACTLCSGRPVGTITASRSCFAIVAWTVTPGWSGVAITSRPFTAHSPGTIRALWTVSLSKPVSSGSAVGSDSTIGSVASGSASCPVIRIPARFLGSLYLGLITAVLRALAARL